MRSAMLYIYLNFKSRIILNIGVLTLILIIVTFAACGKVNKSSIKQIDSRTVLSYMGVNVRVFDENGSPIINPNEKFKIEVVSNATSRQVIVSIKEQIRLRTSYTEVKFDSNREHPTEIQCGAALLDYQPLVFMGSPEAGTVVCAQVVPGDISYDVSGEILKLELTSGKHQVRYVSDFNQDPTTDPIIAESSVDGTDKNKIYWTYKLRGEANNNQVYDFADFGVVGAKYNKVSTDAGCEVADADGKGKVDFADFGIIGANYNRGIGGLKIYRDDATDPTTLLGVLDTGGYIKGDFTLDKAANKTLTSGFKQYWYTCTGSGRYIKVVLLDKNGVVSTGQQQILDTGATTTVLNPVTSVKATDGAFTDRVVITWTPPTSGEYPDGYKIYRASTASGTYTSIGTATSASFDDTSLKDTSVYYYKVSSTLGAKESTLSTEDAGSLSATTPTINPPETVTATDAIYNDKVVVNWTAPKSGDVPDGYKIYRSTTATGSYVPLGTVGAVISYEDVKVPDTNVYYYKVASTKGATESALSASDAGSKKATAPTLNPPTGINASDGMYVGKVSIQWIAPATGEVPDGYQVLRATSATGTYSKVGSTVGVTIFDDLSVPDTSVYYYKILSVKGAFKSAASTEDAGSKKVPAIIINPPTAVKATDGVHANKVVITWTAPTIGDTPDGYKIYRSTAIDGTYSNIATVGAVATYEDTTAKNVTIYYYKVSSTKGSDESVFSKEDTGFITIVNLQGDSWMYGHDQTHSRRSRYIGPVDWKPKWTYTTGDDVQSTPAIDKSGNIYVGCNDYKLYALKSDGTLLWTYDTGAPVYSSPAISADGQIYFGALNGKIYSLNTDGTFNWSYEVGAWVISSPAIAEDGTIYTASYDNSVYALNPDGTLKWSYNTGAMMDSSPAISVDGTVYIGDFDGYLNAFDPNGSLLWRFKTGDDINSSPSIGADGTIYVGSDDDYLYAISSEGKEVWKYKTAGDIFGSPAISVNGYILFGAVDKIMYCLDSSGKEVWKKSFMGEIRCSPTIDAENNVIFTDNMGWLYIYRITDGSSVMSWTYGASQNASPTIAPDGSILIGTYSSSLVAIGPGTGKTGLNPPEKVKATIDVHTGKIALTWDIPSTGAIPDGYYIYRSISNQPTAIYQLIDTALTIGSYNDTSVEPGKMYYYKLVSHKASMKYNNSADSNPPAVGRAL